MLFSQKNVADFISYYFEPVWETVRPVPIVKIDFGNGKEITRTLHGNIATYVCTAEGQALDVLPGIYTPNVYLERLNQFRLLALYVDQQGKEKRGVVLADYHRVQGEALKKSEPPAFLMPEVRDVGKTIAIERNLKIVLAPGVKAAGEVPALKEELKLDSADDLANWKVLAEDTKINESVRRRQIHELLAGVGLVKPEALKKRIYKEVLNADLDDPYLGLGEVLFANYPFAKEDRK